LAQTDPFGDTKATKAYKIHISRYERKDSILNALAKNPKIIPGYLFARTIRKLCIIQINA